MSPVGPARATFAVVSRSGQGEAARTSEAPSGRTAGTRRFKPTPPETAEAASMTSQQRSVSSDRLRQARVPRDTTQPLTEFEKNETRPPEAAQHLHRCRTEDGAMRTSPATHSPRGAHWPGGASLHRRSFRKPSGLRAKNNEIGQRVRREQAVAATLHGSGMSLLRGQSLTPNPSGSGGEIVDPARKRIPGWD
ncbi:MAG: hypothetical protein ACI8RZ_003222 [Myxococcota bacterium]|jgi:hypothetical protein